MSRTSFIIPDLVIVDTSNQRVSNCIIVGYKENELEVTLQMLPLKSEENGRSKSGKSFEFGESKPSRTMRRLRMSEPKDT